MQERTNYRFQPTEGLPVGVEIQKQSGASEVVDISDDSLHVRFRQADAPDLALGIELDVVINLPRREFERAVQVVERRDTDEWRSFNLRFIQRDEDKEELRLFLIKTFQGRTAYRVEPHAAQPVVAAVRFGGSETPIQVKNLSMTGMCAVAELDCDARFAGTRRVQLAISLPETEVPIVLLADIIARNYENGTDAVVEYVMARQRNDLQPA
ncbi:MAG: hypothetical protein CMJ83_22035 [Planctomycetes bacterium]|jgi:hypothetical protein|nr:hypothetical protein [Planctomycetota bacterium]